VRACYGIEHAFDLDHTVAASLSACWFGVCTNDLLQDIASTFGSNERLLANFMMSNELVNSRDQSGALNARKPRISIASTTTHNLDSPRSKLRGNVAVFHSVNRQKYDARTLCQPNQIK